PYYIIAYYMEHNVMEAEAMKSAKARILEVCGQFEKLSGRKYGLFEEYRMEDAQLAVVLIGSSAGTAKAAVDTLREKGVKAGLIKVRVFRPFPAEELAQALAKTKAVAVMDKSEGFSANGGPLFAEVRSALYDVNDRPSVIGIVFGLGGRDLKTEDVEGVFARLSEIAATGETAPEYVHMGHRTKEGAQ
ncbi:MAG: pyruvate ferredoxin oxidoreductase, partial [Clostridia bacterium]|nr:pyruvate ferredoxin oxidoreductase [Clostridia bacterium]